MVEDISRKGHTEVSGDELDWSTIYSILSHANRRALLHALTRYDESLPLADAAEEVVHINSDTPKGDIPPTEVEKCYISLYHRHVPKLTDSGMVTIDEDEILSLTERGEQLVSVQEHIERQNSEFS